MIYSKYDTNVFRDRCTERKFYKMDEEENSKIIEFGITEESHITTKSKTLGTVVPFRSREYLAIGQKGLIRFETNLVKESYPYELTALYYDEERQIYIGVTAHTPEFIILFESNLNLHIMTGIKLEDYCVFNIIFSKKSSTIITAGSHLKTWRFIYTPSTCRVVFELPTVIIEPLDTVFSNINWGLLNPPMFDYEKEELLINDYKGNIISYDLKGRKNCVAVNYGCTDVESCFAYNSDTRQLISNNILQGAVIWNRNGSNSDQTFLGSSLTKFIQFINSEFVILLDARNVLTIFDIITHDFFAVYQIDKEVNRIFFFPEPYPRLLICAKTDVIILRITLPWRYWYTTGSRTIMMKRINKLNEAARVFVELSNAQIRLLSPINSRILTGITLKTLSSPITFFYDRGISSLPAIHRDQILIPLVNGQMQIFSTGENPCEETDCLEMKINCVCQCIYKERYAFCYGTATGDLIFYDYITMKQVGRIVAYPAAIMNVYYHEESDSLLIAIEDRVLRMDLGTGHVINFIRLKYSKLHLFYDGILFFAQESGKVRSVCIVPEDPYQMNDIKYINNKPYKQENNVPSNDYKTQNTTVMNSRTNLSMVSRTNLNNVSKNSVNVSSRSTIKEKEEEDAKEKEKEKSLDEPIKKKLNIPFKLVPHHSNGMTMHDGLITGLSLGSVFFVSCSVDKTLRVWNRDFTQRCLIVFPLPLYSCCALNGKRDVLVSTEKEIMIIDGSIIFDDQVDPEDDLFDNYDKKQDSLYKETTTFVEEEEEEEDQEDFLKQKNDENTSKSHKKRFRFADALRRYEEEKQRRLQEYLNQREDPEYRKKLERILDEAKQSAQKREEERQRLEDEAKEKEKAKKAQVEDEYEYEYEEEEIKIPIIIEEEIKEDVIKKEKEKEKENVPPDEPEKDSKEEEKKKKAVLSNFFGAAKQPQKTKQPSSRPAKKIDVTKYITNNNNNNNSSSKDKNEAGEDEDEKRIKSGKKSKSKKTKATIEANDDDNKSEIADFEEKKKKKKGSKKSPQKQQKSLHLMNPKNDNVSLRTKATNTDYVPPSTSTEPPKTSYIPPQAPVGEPNFGPGFSKITKQRRYPTPLKETKKEKTPNRRSSSALSQRKYPKRSKTPEPRMTIIDDHKNHPPLNIVFDVDMISRMVESGDMRYAPILEYLRSHGLIQDGNTWDVKMSVPPFSSESRSPRRKNARNKNSNRAKGQMANNPYINNYPMNNGNDNNNSKFLRQYMPPPMGQPDFDDEIGMKLFKNRVDELVGTKRLIPPENKNTKIPSFQPKIVPTNQTQLDVTMYTDSILKNNEKGKPNQDASARNSSEEQLAARRAALKKQKELRLQYLLDQQEKQRQQEQQQYVIHYRSSPPLVPPVPIGELGNINNNGGFGLEGQFEASDIVGIQNLIPEEKSPKSSQSARPNYTEHVKMPKRQLSARDQQSPRKQRFKISSDSDYDYNRPSFPSTPDTPRSNEGPHFVEPIMPVYLRASGEIFICDKKISPFACKRYRLVIDENGPKKSWTPISPQAPNMSSGQPLSSALITTQQQASLIDQVNKSPRTVKKPLSQKNMRHV